MRRRILVAIVGVAAGAVFLLALPLGIAVQKLYRDDEVSRLERAATAQARSFDPGAGSGDPVEFTDSTENGDEVAAYSLAGARIGGIGPDTADQLVRATLSTGRVGDTEAGGRLVVAVPVLGGERVVGAVRASRSTKELNERVLRVRLLITGGALAIIGLAAIAALALSRRLSRPLAELAESASGIGGHGRIVASPRSGIRELDTVAEALDETAARLDALLSREREFSANASHQLRTPLAALRIDLESRELSGDDVTAALSQIDRLEATIKTLLTVARDRPREATPFDVDDLLEGLAGEWVGRFAGLSRVIEFTSDHEAVLALASRDVVGEVVEVLIDNARRHGAGTIRVRSRSIAGMLAIDVSDEGAGVDPESEIFARNSGHIHGIGLAIARSLAESEGGRLDLTDPGPGSTTFTLFLQTVDGPNHSPGPAVP